MGASDFRIDSRSAVIYAVSTAESYVDQVLRALVEISGIREIPFAVAMFDELEDVVTRSWDERFKWLRKGFGIALGGTAAQQDFVTLVDLRNALVHGDDQFTQRQTRDLPSLIQLEHRVHQVLSVEVSKGGFLFGPKGPSQALTVARTFILTVDEVVRERHPKVEL